MDKSGSAFPRPRSGELGHGCAFEQDGLTKREWFAGMALQGILFADWKIEQVNKI